MDSDEMAEGLVAQHINRLSVDSDEEGVDSPEARNQTSMP